MVGGNNSAHIEHTLHIIVFGFRELEAQSHDFKGVEGAADPPHPPKPVQPLCSVIGKDRDPHLKYSLNET